jgi:hypothetical protein
VKVRVGQIWLNLVQLVENRLEYALLGRFARGRDFTSLFVNPTQVFYVGDRVDNGYGVFRMAVFVSAESDK